MTRTRVVSRSQHNSAHRSPAARADASAHSVMAQIPAPDVVLAPALHQRVALAAVVVARTLQGEALRSALQTVRSGDDGAAIQDLVYLTLRHVALGRWLIQRLSKPALEPTIEGILLIAFALLHSARYPAHTLVNQAVSATPRRARNVVNALLRRYLREVKTLTLEWQQDPCVVYNLPRWWLDQLQLHYANDWRAIAAAQQQKAPLTLRVNTAKISVADFVAQLQAAHSNSRCVPLANDYQLPAVMIEPARNVTQLSGFAAGHFVVQDIAAQLAVPLLEVMAGMTVLDACAAPGGKTTHLVQQWGSQVRVVALDNEPERLERVRDNLSRLQLDCEIICADAATFNPQQLAGADTTAAQALPHQFERILADLPCSASGIVRRHPDIPWLRRPEDVTQLAQKARAILDHLWTLVAPGGMLLMVTCSLWPEESSEQARAFALRHADARLVVWGQLLPGGVHSQISQFDGLFYAQLWKASHNQEIA